MSGRARAAPSLVPRAKPARSTCSKSAALAGVRATCATSTCVAHTASAARTAPQHEPALCAKARSARDATRGTHPTVVGATTSAAGAASSRAGAACSGRAARSAARLHASHATAVTMSYVLRATRCGARRVQRTRTFTPANHAIRHGAVGVGKHTANRAPYAHARSAARPHALHATAVTLSSAHVLRATRCGARRVPRTRTFTSANHAVRVWRNTEETVKEPGHRRRGLHHHGALHPAREVLQHGRCENNLQEHTTFCHKNSYYS